MGAQLPKRRPVNTLPRVALLLACLGAVRAASFVTEFSKTLPWAESPDNQREPSAVFDAPDGSGGQTVVAVAGLSPFSWELAGISVAASGASAKQVWSTLLRMGAGLPSAVAVAGELAVLELDGRVFGVHPHNGSLAWNATSPCSLGRPRPVSARSSSEPVYLVCQELSGDSTLIALAPADGSTAWAISSSAISSALAPVRAAAAAPGMLIYATTGSNLTALSAGEGAVMWQLDVAELALPQEEQGVQQGTSITHLQLAGDVLLVREYAAGLSFTAGPFSYLALQLSATGGPPSLLWSANSTAQRDRLPPGLTEASPAVPPSLSEAADVFYYWASSAAPPPPPPSPPPPAPPLPVIVPQWTAGVSSTEGGEGAGGEAAAAAAPSPAARRRLLEASGSLPAPGQNNNTLEAPAPGPSAPAADANSTAALDAASAEAEAAAAAEAVLASAVPAETQGMGVVAPEGYTPTPVLKARSLSTGEELWSLQLSPVSAPSAAADSVAVVTLEGLQVLDSASGALMWQVNQQPLGIYGYTPTLLGTGGAAALRNCLDTMASNSLCIYSDPEADGKVPGQSADGASPTSSAVGMAPLGGVNSLFVLFGLPAVTLQLLVAAGAAAALLLLL